MEIIEAIPARRATYYEVDGASNSDCLKRSSVALTIEAKLVSRVANPRSNLFAPRTRGEQFLLLPSNRHSHLAGRVAASRPGDNSPVYSALAGYRIWCGLEVSRGFLTGLRADAIDLKGLLVHRSVVGLTHARRN